MESDSPQTGRFLKNALKFAKLGYDLLWDELSHQPVGEDPPDIADEFDKAVDGLWPYEFEQLLLSAVLRDAVSVFEYYLEQAAEEVLSAHGCTFPRRDPQESPKWGELRDFCLHYLGVDISTDEVCVIRQLRHILTHQQGELRTEKTRSVYSEGPETPGHTVKLNPEDVLSYVDVLGEVIRSVDRVAYEFSWGGRRLDCF